MRYPLIFKFLRSKQVIFAFFLICLSEIGYAYFANWITYWNKDFYDALQAKQILSISPFIYKFVFLCLASYFFFVFSSYLEKHVALRWRFDMVKKLNHHWLTSWHYLYPKCTNTDQRIVDDTQQVSEILLSLIRAGLRSFFLLLIFLPTLWSISTQLNSVPGLLVWVALGMALFGSVGFQVLFVNPLKKLQQVKEETNAALRSHLHYLSVHAEQVSMLQGAKVEEFSLLKKLQITFQASVRFVYSFISLQYVKEIFIKTNSVLALFILAPFFLKGIISFGVLGQGAVIFFYISDAFSFLPRYSDQLALFHAALNRLKILDESLAEKIEGNLKVYSSSLQVNNLSVQVKEKTLLKNINFELKMGESVMIKGKSGVGKTTLLRVLAGLWKEYEGAVKYSVKREEMFFASTHVYIPLLNLYESVAYPTQDFRISDIKKCLEIVGLNVDENINVNRLSSGQKQRLALARVLYAQPKYVFLDEPTSSLPAQTAHELLSRVYKALPNSAFLTISHQDNLEDLHNKNIELS